MTERHLSHTFCRQTFLTVLSHLTNLSNSPDLNLVIQATQFGALFISWYIARSSRTLTIWTKSFTWDRPYVSSVPPLTVAGIMCIWELMNDAIDQYSRNDCFRSFILTADTLRFVFVISVTFAWRKLHFCHVLPGKKLPVLMFRSSSLTSC